MASQERNEWDGVTDEAAVSRDSDARGEHPLAKTHGEMLLRLQHADH